jgi:hypothetical protein
MSIGFLLRSFVAFSLFVYFDLVSNAVHWFTGTVAGIVVTALEIYL